MRRELSPLGALALYLTLSSLGVAAPARAIDVPLSFAPNVGQSDPSVRYVAHGAGYTFLLAPTEMVLNLDRAMAVETIRMTLAGANPRARIAGTAQQAGVVNYFLGNDPTQWRTSVPTYGRVQVSDVYPGIDLVFYGNQQSLEYDFVVAPGADPACIAWRMEGPKPGVDSAGDLQLSVARFRKPVVYQLDGTRRKIIDAGFVVEGDRVRFRVGAYDHSRPLVIDPVLSYATYIGGSGTDTIGAATGPGNLLVGASQGLAVDSTGSVYVAGSTNSANFPTRNPYQGTLPTKLGAAALNTTVFVSKFSPDGSSLVYSTYLGGNGGDHAYAIAVDAAGSAYVTGMTSSVNFPITSGAYQTVCSPTPTNQPPPYTSGCNSSNVSAFVTKLNPAGTALAYSTFLGGYGYAYATAIAVDAAGRAYIAGNETQYCSTTTFKGCFPTTDNAVITGDKTGGRSPQYAFVAALDAAGARLLYSSIFGSLEYACMNGCGATWGTGVTVDSSGNFYLIGETQASKFPTTAGVVQPTAGPLDAANTYVLSYRGFVAKFNPVTATPTLAYCTYLGGHTSNTGDFLSGIAVDDAGNAFLAGYTNSMDFPVTAGVFGASCAGSSTCSAAHITKLNPAATSIVWSTYVGHSKRDGSDAMSFVGPVKLDAAGNVYLIAQSNGTGFPMVNPVEPTPNGGSQQVLLMELDPAGSKLLFSTMLGSNGLNTASPAGLGVDAAGNIYVAGNNNGPNLVTTPGAFQTASTDGACCQYGNGFVVKIASTAPALDSGSLANGATYLPGGLVSGSWAQVHGSNLATTTRIWSGTDFAGLGNGLPTSLNGTQVLVNNIPAAVYYISPTQVSFQVPAGVSGSASVQVIVNGVTSNTVTASAVTNAPGIFPIIVNGTNYAAAVLADGKIALDPSIGAGFRNAVPGDVVSLYATGVAPSPAGTLVSVTLLDGVTVTVGDVTVPAVGSALVAPGEFQVNFVVPSSFASKPVGAYPISISINGASSPSSINSIPPGPVVIPIGH